MHDPALIIFDVDGTLLQAQMVTVPAVHSTFESYGLPLPDPGAIRATFGIPVEEYEAWLASMCPAELAEEIVHATNRRELELITEVGELYPGTHDVLAALKREGHALATCSNASVAYLDAVLDGHDIRRYFDIIRCIGHGFDGKAATISNILEESSYRPAIVVGDRSGDVTGAHANGALAVGATYGYGDSAELADADAFITSLHELPAVLETLIGDARIR